MLLVLAPPDPRLEASCRYARSADERERDKLVTWVEDRVCASGQIIWGVDRGYGGDITLLSGSGVGAMGGGHLHIRAGVAAFTPKEPGSYRVTCATGEKS